MKERIKYIKKTNMAIAEYMGAMLHKDWTNAIYTEPHDTYEFITPATKHASIHWLPEELQYLSSWEWLMPVVEKISKERYKSFPIVISISGGGGAHIAINHSNCAGQEYEGERIIANTLNTNYMINDEEFEYTSIELVWFAVGLFVKWYNKNKE